MPKRLTTEEFIEKAKAKHGDKYDYSKVEYKNNSTKVRVTCPIHGAFEQIPAYHLSGSGCYTCGVGSRGIKQAKDTKSFISDAVRVHGGRYDYSKVEYKNCKTKVLIVCPLHGDFPQIPSNHLSGRGCSACGGNERSNTAEFIEKAKAVHSDKYDYSKVEYLTAISRVTITCPIHSDFRQTPNKHLGGQGCPSCHSYTGLTAVYLVRIESHGEEMLKIGITNHKVEQRFSDGNHPDQNATEIATLEFKDREDARTIEAYLHTKHRKHKFTPKVKFSGHTECFNIEALETIKQDFGV